jgi:hypothetical protein
MVHKYPALAALKDVIWLESGDTTLVVIQQQFVDVIKGRKSNTMAQTIARSQDNMLVHQNQNYTNKNKPCAKRNKAVLHQT